MFLVLYVLLTVGLLLNRYKGDLFLVSLKVCLKSLVTWHNYLIEN